MLGLIYHFQRDVVREGEKIGLGDPVVASRRVIALPTDARQRQRLLEISRSRTEPTGRVERARIILAYLDDPSAYAVARAIGVTQQTVTRCLERAAELGVIEALDDRPRAGTDAARENTLSGGSRRIRGDRGAGRSAACGTRSSHDRRSEDLAGGIGVSEGQGIGLSPRAVDPPATRRTRSSAWTDRRASEPGEAGPGNGLQDPGRA